MYDAFGLLEKFSLSKYMGSKTKYVDFFTENNLKKVDLDSFSDKTTLYLRRFPGPLQDHTVKDVIRDIHVALLKGRQHRLYAKYQNTYGTQGMSSNILVPFLHDGIARDMIILCHPDNCSRIARNHVRKVPNLVPIMLDSLISTTNNDHWREQRVHLVQSFLPSSLEKTIPTSESRAKKSVSLLNARLQRSNTVDMSDFLLNETQAQLQLALFGSEEEFEKRTNKDLRMAFSGLGRKGFVRDFSLDMINKIQNNTHQGVLSSGLKSSPQTTDTELYGNIILFAFAGHDTTGHTLTWLIYELCKNMKIQGRLYKEVEAFWRDQRNRPIQFSDFERLPFMKKCIFETLRLWPAVANGTFRQLEYDDHITDDRGIRVLIPKGTYVQISNWHRHRNEGLWGKDVDIFNPDRNFSADETWETNFSFINPESPKFSPFTYNPRSCIGKVFANIEMRLILLHLIKNFTFLYHDAAIEFNQGTMRPKYGLKVKVVPRHSKL